MDDGIRQAYNKELIYNDGHIYAVTGLPGIVYQGDNIPTGTKYKKDFSGE